MPNDLPLSMLDLAPVREGSNAIEALKRVNDLAKLGDRLGFERLWYAEHHGIPSIAATVPALMIAHAAENTSRIRLGSGGVMLPNHVPLHVVESYMTLNALYPGRIDLGIGRAGGTDGLTMQALRSTPGDAFPRELMEMLAFARGGFDEEHPYSRVRVTPEGVDLPPVWLLGSSGASAQFSGQLGLGYGFAGHFSPAPARPAFEAYKAAFSPSAEFPEPHALLCLNVICAPTAAEAQFLAGSMRLSWVRLRSNRAGPLPSPETAAAYTFSPMEEALAAEYARMQIVGDPETVRAEIEARAESAGADEVMITTTIYDDRLRLRSFELVAEAFGLDGSEVGDKGKAGAGLV